MKKKRYRPDNPQWAKKFVNMVKKMDIGLPSLTEDKPLPEIDFSAPIKSYQKIGKGKS